MVDFMQTSLGVLLRKAKNISEALIWFEAFDRETKDEIVKWIQQDQLTKKGVDENGEVIGYYSFLTELISGGAKKFNTPYTLDDTGQFYRSMYVVALRDSIVIEADGDKGEDNLFEKYGEGIIGLTDENMENLREVIREKYIEYISRTLAVS